MTEWRSDMENAPFGTPCLVFRRKAPEKRRIGVDGRSETIYAGAWAYSRRDEQPTHWMPLPEPPK